MNRLKLKVALVLSGRSHNYESEDLVRDAALITESIIQTDLKAYLPENGGKKPDARARRPRAFLNLLTRYQKMDRTEPA